MSRYQSGLGLPGVMATEEWFAALMAGVDGPLGHVVDVGCAEGVMCALAAAKGAQSVLGFGLHDDRLVAARALASDTITIREQDAASFDEPADTVVFSMMAHWLGRDETARFARLARRHFLVVFREANDHYAPENGSWFPTFAELDVTVGGIRTHEQLLMTQDNGKRTWAATYRMDMTLRDGIVRKRTYSMPFFDGRDLHGDPPFRPTHDAPLVDLTPDDREKVRALIRDIASAALVTGFYPTDLSPRNVIVGKDAAHLVDLDEIEPYRGAVDEQYLAIWRRTLSTVGMTFSGDLGELL